MNLQDISKELGLCAIGTAQAADLKEEYDHLLKWILKGYHGKMEWLAKSAKRRCSPSQLMPMPKSVIVSAMRYDDMPMRSKADKVEGKQGEVRYLQHQDYHVVMMEKLEALTARIKEAHPNAHFKCYVDTGPVLEKTWAALAGIGFIGKNTLLIIPGIGSQVALGVVVTDVILSEAKDPLNNGDPSVAMLPQDDMPGCADCTACITACPEHALVEPYTLDARKCLSYKYFIEKRDGGCDVCQNVCPFNRSGS